MDPEYAPTELTVEDIDTAINTLLNSEIKPVICMRCGKEYFGGHSDSECDECFFSRWPEKEIAAYIKSFL